MVDRETAAIVPLIDNDLVRVTRFDFTPGAQTGWHRHEYDYVITAITDLGMLLEEPGGNAREVDIPSGQAYQRKAGIEHNVINRGSENMSFIEVELKPQ
ncbi:MAG: cupin [Acidiferrobacteraceae bacterium]|jgi:quercetin dioxygenase-like cupin family protein|nr:cupin [Acidiferrobacteraceae bacterium]MBT3639247.1 cupin [Acidiferrobacteraceae bacterium]MBT3768431.1 cupin [Acidiferrobacteraceae bacterium]MBT3973916.1 cupin [Acidiferrobacteraceae bacterium]MBT4404858.1 cupin [Acidiferrobacteraceae bacterium]